MGRGGQSNGVDQGLPAVCRIAGVQWDLAPDPPGIESRLQICGRAPGSDRPLPPGAGDQAEQQFRPGGSAAGRGAVDVQARMRILGFI